MDIKPVSPTAPPPPLHRVEQDELARREQRRRRQPGEGKDEVREEVDVQAHVDLYA